MQAVKCLAKGWKTEGQLTVEAGISFFVTTSKPPWDPPSLEITAVLYEMRHLTFFFRSHNFINRLYNLLT
jgi:hypothetical protein